MRIYKLKVPVHQNGAAIKNIEVTEAPNVIPEGAMHKELNHLDLDVTKKGISVITVKDDSAETFPEIKAQEDSLVQHAEIEENEIIFNKELTDKINSMRKEWNKSKDESLLLEAGKILVKEILFNTEDNTGLIDKIQEKV